MRSILMIMLCVLCVMFGDVEAGDSVNKCQHSLTDSCSLFSLKTDRVSVQDLMDKNVMSGGWFMLYGSEFVDVQSYGKCNYKWSQSDSNKVIQRQLICYNSKLEKCESFDANVTLQDDDCGEATETGVNSSLNGKFYSQDANQYLLYYTCYSYNNSGECKEGYLDIIVRDFRYRDSTDNEINLQGVPWHMLSADLKNRFDFEFSSKQVFFYWKGPECGFDGNIITSSAGWIRRSFFALILMTFVALGHVF